MDTKSMQEDDNTTYSNAQVEHNTTYSVNEENAEENSLIAENLTGRARSLANLQLAGTRKGSKNRTTILLEILRKYKFDPAAKAVEMINKDSTSEAGKIALINSLMQKVYPNLKSSELKVEQNTTDQRFVFVVQDAPVNDKLTVSVNPSLTVDADYTPAIEEIKQEIADEDDFSDDQA